MEEMYSKECEGQGFAFAIGFAEGREVLRKNDLAESLGRHTAATNPEITGEEPVWTGRFYAGSELELEEVCRQRDLPVGIGLNAFRRELGPAYGRHHMFEQGFEEMREVPWRELYDIKQIE